MTTKTQKVTDGIRSNADNGALTLVPVVAWLAAAYGFELPPGISELVAGWVVMLGTRIKGVIR